MPTRLISPLVHFPSAGNSGSVSQIPSNRDTIKKRIHLFFLRVCGCVFPCFRHQPSSLETLVCLPSDKQSTARARPDATWSSAAPPSDPSDSGLGAARSHACQPTCHSLPNSVSSDRLHDRPKGKWNREREQTKKKTCHLTHQPSDSRAILDSFIHSLFTVSSSSRPRPQARCTFALSISSQVPETQRGRGIESYSPPHHHHDLLLCTVVSAGFVSLFHLFFGQGPFPFHTPNHPPPKPLSSCSRLPGPATT